MAKLMASKDAESILLTLLLTSGMHAFFFYRSSGIRRFVFIVITRRLPNNGNSVASHSCIGFMDLQ